MYQGLRKRLLDICGSMIDVFDQHGRLQFENPPPAGGQFWRFRAKELDPLGALREDAGVE